MQALTRRVEELRNWLKEHAPNCEVAQKHLDEGTAEQAYWHFGYLCALRDVNSMLSQRSAE